MRSVPPRGSGWVPEFSISDCQLASSPAVNRKSAIDNRQSRDPPATAGVTDLMVRIVVLRASTQTASGVRGNVAGLYSIGTGILSNAEARFIT
jgi:hypothetical protein